MDNQPNNNEDLDFTTIEGINGAEKIADDFKVKIEAAKRAFNLALSLKDEARMREMEEKRKELEATASRLDISSEEMLTPEKINTLQEEPLASVKRSINVKLLALDEYQASLRAENPVELAKFAEIKRRMKVLEEKKKLVEQAEHSFAEINRASEVFERVAQQK